MEYLHSHLLRVVGPKLTTPANASLTNESFNEEDYSDMKSKDEACPTKEPKNFEDYSSTKFEDDADSTKEPKSTFGGSKNWKIGC
ncbi:hypothetical protein Csa_016598 [Cucumis sativus]|nr:hypothetical protein Csa_016598 [Cucumis sativus]